MKLLTAVLLCSLWLPLASAQAGEALQVRIDDRLDENPLALNSGRLVPESLGYEYAVVATVRCADVPSGGLLTLTVESSLQTVRVAAETDRITIAAGECTTSAKEFSFDVRAVAERSAPAFKAAIFSHRVLLDRTTPAGSSPVQQADVSHQIAIDYVPILEYEAGFYDTMAPPGKHSRFLVQVTSLGNGETRVTTRTDPPEPEESVTPPAPVTLDSKAERGGAAKFETTLWILVRAPAQSGETNTVTLRFNATSTVAAEGVLVDEQTITLSVQARGSYLPGPGPLEFLSFLFFSAFLAHRRMH